MPRFERRNGFHMHRRWFMDSKMFYNIMPDGTVKQVNPFTGTEVWTVAGRGKKPITNAERIE